MSCEGKKEMKRGKIRGKKKKKKKGRTGIAEERGRKEDERRVEGKET